MANSRDLQLIIGGEQVAITQVEDFPVSISYTLEDKDNFQNKRSAESFDISIPATLENSKISNSFHNPNIEDSSAAQYYRNPRSCTIVANGIEVFKGKALMQAASHTDRPERYVYDCYGQNGDWLVDLQEKTMWDFVNSNTHLFTQAVAEFSWNFDGRNENQDYVYAPVRYKKAFATNDLHVTMLHMRPSLFVWPFLLRAFRSVGYTIKSGFMDTDYFRRLVLPWVWGNFLRIDSSVADVLKFRATGFPTGTYASGLSQFFFASGAGSGGAGTSGGGYIFAGAFGPNGTTVRSDFNLQSTTLNGAFDNGGLYSYTGATGAMNWQYRAVNGITFGTISARFGLKIIGNVAASVNSNASVYADVFKNGTLIQSLQVFTYSAGSTSSGIDEDVFGRAINFTVGGLVLNDVVSVRLRYTYGTSRLGQASVQIQGYREAYADSSGTAIPARGSTFELFGISIALGGLVDLKRYDKFKNFKILDLLRGLCDTFDLIIQTDSISKVVYIESAYDTILNDGNAVVTPGYFSVAKKLNWDDKLDLSQLNEIQSYSDTEQVQFFKFRADNNDGGLQKFEARWSITGGAAKYILPERFKTGKKDVENRFFSPVIHIKMTQWTDITASGLATQLIVMVPENISNTSADEAENQLSPKLAWYKGLIPREQVGGWWWWPDPENPFTSVPDRPAATPYMFAVNYAPGGHRDPVLAYNDQKIGTDAIGYTLGRGLLKRFFLQRMAIQEYGKRYTPFIMLTTGDVTNWLHQEAIQLGGADYHLIGISDYKPLLPVSTRCTFWKYIPASQANVNNIYPSVNSTVNNPTTLPTNDLLYQPLLLLKSDLK